MNTNDKNSNTKNNDKTVVSSQSKNVDKRVLEITRVQQPSATTDTVNNNDKTAIDTKANVNGVNDSDINADINVNSKPTSERKGVSKSVLAAGIAGAGIAGVAAGTVFSEEIKGAVEAIAASFPGNSDDIPEITEEISQGSASLTFSDATGVYEITLTDTLGDANIDNLEFEAQLVDGTNVQFAASGTLLDQMFNNEQIETASANDYLTNALGVFDGFTPESTNSTDYQILQGDTLSEIAAANNTSVAHIMELNPNISDPNMILAGDHLIIPSNDFVLNPYEGWNPQWNQSSDVFLAQNETTYDTMDWASFEDQPLDDYAGYLQAESFDDYSLAESYFDVNNDLSSLDFFA